MNKGGGKNQSGCWNCGDPRHWSKDCPHMRVKQVTMDGGEQWDASSGWEHTGGLNQQQSASSSTSPPYYQQDTNVQRVQQRNCLSLHLMDHSKVLSVRIHHKEVQIPIEVVLVVQHWEVQQYDEFSTWIFH